MVTVTVSVDCMRQLTKLVQKQRACLPAGVPDPKQELQLLFLEKRKLRRVLTLCTHTRWKESVCRGWFRLLNKSLKRSQALAKAGLIEIHKGTALKSLMARFTVLLTREMKQKKANWIRNNQKLFTAMENAKG